MMYIRGTGTVKPFEVYTTYLALKRHFSSSYDYFKYRGKTRCSESSFYSRKDRYFFERMSRKLSDEEVKLYFLSCFLATDNPSSIWVGEIMRTGENNFRELVKRHQSMSYIFTQECEAIFSEHKLPEAFDATMGHPPILKGYLRGEVSIETLVILEMIFGFSKNLDRKLKDPVWDIVCMKMKKYRPFLNIELDKFKKILRNIVYV
ncbi:loader of DNA helicase [Synechococcus phage ACG-2014f]|uniref:Loader of DNA helicase n=1 Tax=Synechococcus phage ACG-2014f TaxID=1493511 RepID=A0A0E3FNM8_9CAUD|nr:loader of DNA helicase [Synechococcus phage ACG-2014f]